MWLVMYMAIYLVSFTCRCRLPTFSTLRGSRCCRSLEPGVFRPFAVLQNEMLLYLSPSVTRCRLWAYFYHTLIAKIA